MDELNDAPADHAHLLSGKMRRQDRVHVQELQLELLVSSWAGRGRRADRRAAPWTGWRGSERVGEGRVYRQNMSLEVITVDWDIDRRGSAVPTRRAGW